MGIRQQKRPHAPRPEVRETDYGASYVKAATERPLEPEVVKPEDQKKKEEAVAAEVGQAPVVEDEQAVAEEAKSVVSEEKKPSVKPKKKGGRPKKTK